MLLTLHYSVVRSLDASRFYCDIAQDLLSHSLFVRLILCSAGAGRNCVLLTLHYSVVRSLDASRFY